MLPSIRKKYLVHLEQARRIRRRFENLGRSGVSFDEPVLERSKAYAIWLDLLDEFVGRSLGKALGKLLKIWLAIYFAQAAFAAASNSDPETSFAPSVVASLQNLFMYLFVAGLTAAVFYWYRREARKSWKKFEAGFDDYAKLDDLILKMEELVRRPGAEADEALSESLNNHTKRLAERI
jgi:hypothetical protein